MFSPTGGNEPINLSRHGGNSILSKALPSFEVMSNPEQEEMLTESSLEQIHQNLEENASKANSEGVLEILEEHGS